MWAIPLWLGLCLAAWLDLTTRRIPNSLNLGMAVFGLGASVLGLGRVDALSALGAMGTALAVMLLPFALRIYKGGDLKMVVAASAWLTPREVLWAILMGVVLGGILGLCHIGLRKEDWQRTWAAIWLVVMGAKIVVADDPSSKGSKVPMGVAFGAGILATAHGATPWG